MAASFEIPVRLSPIRQERVRVQMLVGALSRATRLRSFARVGVAASTVVCLAPPLFRACCAPREEVEQLNQAYSNGQIPRSIWLTELARLRSEDEPKAAAPDSAAAEGSDDDDASVGRRGRRPLLRRWDFI